MRPGDLCVAQYPFCVNYLDMCELVTSSYQVFPGEIFILLDVTEITELSYLEVQILFENKKMWFNIHDNDCNIEYVRRAESYDIPFLTLQEVEPGSNSSSLVKHIPPPPKAKGYFSHFFFS